MIDAPYPTLDEILVSIGETGHRISEIEASEGAAGNISVYLSWPVELRRQFPDVTPLELPIAVPELAGATFVVTGSGRRLREIAHNPYANLACIRIDEGGRTGQVHTSRDRLFVRPTSEFNSHLAVHADQISRTGTNFHALVHAQPLHITYLSHITRYRDTVACSRAVLRWQPEILVMLPEGLGVLPFEVPGSNALMAANVDALRRHQLVVWSKHGVMARSDISVKRAADRIEYAETGAKYEYMNLMAGEPGEGLSDDELRAIAQAFGLKQSIF